MENNVTMSRHEEILPKRPDLQHSDNKDLHSTLTDNFGSRNQEPKYERDVFTFGDLNSISASDHDSQVYYIMTSISSEQELNACEQM
jgi:hypothetical protein